VDRKCGCAESSKKGLYARFNLKREDAKAMAVKEKVQRQGCVEMGSGTSAKTLRKVQAEKKDLTQGSRQEKRGPNKREHAERS